MKWSVTPSIHLSGQIQLYIHLLPRQLTALKIYPCGRVSLFCRAKCKNCGVSRSSQIERAALAASVLSSLASLQRCLLFHFFFFLFNFIYRDLYLQDHPYLDVICTNSELTHKDDSDAISSWQQLVLLGCLCGKAGFVRINTRTDFQPDNDAIDIHC